MSLAIPFLNNGLGDIDLDPYCFRVFAHLSRVHQSLGCVFEALADGAKHCCIGLAKYRQCIRELESLNAIAIEEHPGEKLVIRIKPTEDWDDSIKSAHLKAANEGRSLMPACNSVLDDLALPVTPFRVFAHIVRRCSGNGVFYESYLNAADHCLMSLPQFYRQLSRLLKLNLIVIKKGSRYHPNQIRINDPRLWDKKILRSDSPPSIEKTPIKSEKKQPTPIVFDKDPYQICENTSPPPLSDLRNPIYIKDLEDQERSKKKIGEEKKENSPSFSKLMDSGENVMASEIANAKTYLECDQPLINSSIEKSTVQKRSEVPPPTKKSKQKMKWFFKLKPGGTLDCFRRDFLEWIQRKFKLESLFESAQLILEKDRGFENTDEYIESLCEDFSYRGKDNHVRKTQKRSADDVYQECLEYANKQITDISAIANQVLNWSNGREWFLQKHLNDPVVFKAEYTTYFNRLEAQNA